MHQLARAFLLHVGMWDSAVRQCSEIPSAHFQMPSRRKNRFIDNRCKECNIWHNRSMWMVVLLSWVCSIILEKKISNSTSFAVKMFIFALNCTTFVGNVHWAVISRVSGVLEGNARPMRATRLGWRRSGPTGGVDCWPPAHWALLGSVRGVPFMPGCVRVWVRNVMPLPQQRATGPGTSLRKRRRRRQAAYGSST